MYIYAHLDAIHNVETTDIYTCIKLDDGWPESVEEQGLLLLVWRRNIRNDI